MSDESIDDVITLQVKLADELLVKAGIADLRDDLSQLAPEQLKFAEAVSVTVENLAEAEALEQSQDEILTDLAATENQFFGSSGNVEAGQASPASRNSRLFSRGSLSNPRSSQAPEYHEQVLGSELTLDPFDSQQSWKSEFAEQPSEQFDHLADVIQQEIDTRTSGVGESRYEPTSANPAPAQRDDTIQVPPIEVHVDQNLAVTVSVQSFDRLVQDLQDQLLPEILRANQDVVAQTNYQLRKALEESRNAGIFGGGRGF